MARTNTPYEIIWRPVAENDLDGIIDYIALDSPTKAEDFGQALRDKTLQLAQNPKIGRTGRPGLPALVRELVVHPNYIVFYRVVDKHRIVEILRVRHVAQQTP